MSLTTRWRSTLLALPMLLLVSPMTARAYPFDPWCIGPQCLLESYPTFLEPDSIGPPAATGDCPSNTCCYPMTTNDVATGDAFYHPLIRYSDVTRWWSSFEMESDDWDDGWGFHEWWNPIKPLARLFHALYALQYSAPAGVSRDSALSWGYRHVMGEGEEPIPDCSTDASATAKNRVGDEWIQLHYPFFYWGNTVVRRASTLVHEARHLTSCSHNGGKRCPRAASCDVAWDHGCAGGGGFLMPKRAGANQFGIVWLWDFFRDAVNTTAPMRLRALAEANGQLATSFNKDPCFRIGPDGQAYQLPLTACTSHDEYGSRSLIRPEEFQLKKCLKEGSGAVFSTPCNYYGSWGQQWELTPVLDNAGNPRTDGAVRIVDAQHPWQCMRLGATPTPQLMADGTTCDRVPWLTPVVLGRCEGREAEFFVTPWAPENTLDVRTEDEYRRWRIRPAIQCMVPGTHGVVDGDSCLDANADGRGQLQVFWCHDSPRQQFRATDWY